MNLDKFILFDPLTDRSTDLPKDNGDYIVTIRDIKNRPTCGYDIVTPLFRGHRIIYTGITSSGLRNRIGNQHLGTNAGRSTLRQSLGCLIGFPQIPRDPRKLENRMARFNERDEAALLDWIKENLLFYYLPNPKPETLEEELIEAFNPPLNLQKNHNPVNAEFRETLSALRRNKPWLKK